MTSNVEHEVTYGRDNFVAQHGLWTDEKLDAAEEVREKLKEHKIRFVRVVFANVHGIARGKTITVENFLTTLRNGLNVTVALLAMDSGNIAQAGRYNM